MSTTVPIAATVQTELSSIPPRKPRFNVRLLKVGRQIHLYIGVFSSPALLFFAFSGALQTFSLHQTKKSSDYQPANWIAVMGELHKNQTTQLPTRKAQPVASSSWRQATVAVSSEQSSKAAPNQPAAVLTKGVDGSTHHPLPLKIFFVIVSLGFFSSVLTGVCMSYRYNRNKILVTAVFTKKDGI